LNYRQLARRNWVLAGISTNGVFAMGFISQKRANTPLVVSGMRPYGRWNLRVALDASFVSRKRLETLAIAPKTNSERIDHLRNELFLPATS
jgi:hypothetical protein